MITVDSKLRRLISRCADSFAFLGNHVALPYSKDSKNVPSLLAKSFDVIVDSVFFSDVGVYVKCCLEVVTKEELNQVLYFCTQRKREIWVWRFKKDVPNDKGRALIYKIEGEEIILEPKNWPIRRVMSSTNIKEKTRKKL